ncbi:hypothetical protein Poly30_45900 [Planctomycetes bacterium Poly30]|uniref:HAMP domain-containing protein n=1 Tax=Saltatorellus ferox TaxID=2528018 RepID=A0A518EY66_9BACT|nr:hypothetical protein Poly30_45900 [Planctomycetes bacterium Poly30]
MSRPYKRRKKLIKPRLQLRMSGIFVGLVTLMLLLQSALLTASLHHVANTMPNDSALLLGQTNDLAIRLVLISAAVFLPLTLMVGVLSTFRIAGPLYRFERFLLAVQNGENPGDFTLRDGDELKDLAALINSSTAPLRQDGAHDASESDTTTADHCEERAA